MFYLHMANELLFFIQIFAVAMITRLCRGLGPSALVAWLCLQAVLANVLVLKMVTLFGMDVTVSDAYTIGSLYTLNLLQAHYGRRQAQTAVLASFCLMLAVALLLALHLQFSASTVDSMALVYAKLFQAILPIMLTSAVIFTLIQCVDYALFGYLQTHYGRLSVSLRIVLSILVSQCADTYLFTYWALGGWIASFAAVFFWSYALKIVITLVLAFSDRRRSAATPLAQELSHYVQI